MCIPTFLVFHLHLYSAVIENTFEIYIMEARGVLHLNLSPHYSVIFRDFGHACIAAGYGSEVTHFTSFVGKTS